VASTNSPVETLPDDLAMMERFIRFPFTAFLSSTSILLAESEAGNYRLHNGRDRPADVDHKCFGTVRLF
jgi:hypothetical protein